MPGRRRPSTSTGWCGITTCGTEPQLGEVAINLTGKADRDRASHDIALDLRERLALPLPVPAGTSLKVVEPPPGPPVISTLLAEVYGPDAATRREAAHPDPRRRSRPCPSSWTWTTASAPRRAVAGDDLQR